MRASARGLALLALVAATSASASAQAGITYFGSGCMSVATRKPPALIHEGVPRLGQAFTLALDDGGRAPGSFTDLLLVGVSNTTFGPLVLPSAVPALGICPLRVSMDLVLVLPPGAPLSVGLTVPQDINLVGQSIYFQWWVGWNPVPGPPLVWGSSNGADALIGS